VTLVYSSILLHNPSNVYWSLYPLYLRPWADAIMGVNFFGDIAPDDFGSYDLAFVTIFTMTAGNSWVDLPSQAVLHFQIRSSIALIMLSLLISADAVAYYSCHYLSQG
jgi:hypothetical protein